MERMRIARRAAGRAHPTVLLAVMAAMTMPVLAAEDLVDGPGSGVPATVMVTLKIGGIEPGARSEVKTYRLLALDGGSTEMMTGWRYPFPTTTYHTASAKGKEPVPVTSFTYQNVGMLLRFDTHVLVAGRIRLRGEVEVSGVNQEAAAAGPGIGPGAPKLGTFNHHFDTVLRDGRESIVSMVPNAEGGSITVMLQADLVE